MAHTRKFAPIARDYALYRLLALAGLRINEAVMLDVKDCRFDLGEHGKLHVRFGKGSRGSGYKSRWVPMLDGLDQLLHWYLERVRSLFTTAKEGPLFLAESGKRIDRDTSRAGLARRQKQLGLTPDEMFTPHQLRHAFASMLDSAWSGSAHPQRTAWSRRDQHDLCLHDAWFRLRRAACEIGSRQVAQAATRWRGVTRWH